MDRRWLRDCIHKCFLISISYSLILFWNNTPFCHKIVFIVFSNRKLKNKESMATYLHEQTGPLRRYNPSQHRHRT